MTRQAKLVLAVVSLLVVASSVVVIVAVTTGGTSPISASQTNTQASAPTTSDPGVSSPRATSAAPPPTSAPPARPPGQCPVVGKNLPGATDPWEGCFPGPGNTGVPAGITLADYTGPMDITVDGTIIDGQLIKGLLTISARDVTVKNSRVLGMVIGGSVVDNNSRPYSLSIVDSTIDSKGSSYVGSFKSLDLSNVKALRVDVSGANSGGECSDCSIVDSWVHGPFVEPSSAQHMSGYRMDMRTTITHSTLQCDFVPTADANAEQGCSADLTGYGDDEPVQDNTISKNLFMPAPAGAYCAYGGSSTGKPFSDQASHIVFTDNVFQRGPNGGCALYGPVGDWDGARPGNVWSGNTWADGTPLEP